MRRSRGLQAVLVALVACVALPQAATGAHPSAEQPADAAAEQRLYKQEAATLGPEHAAEHAAARERSRAGAALPVYKPTKPNAVKSGGKRKVGRWTRKALKLPNFAIHAVLLPTGKVLFWGYPPRNQRTGELVNGGEAALWNPRKGMRRKALKRVPPPPLDPEDAYLESGARAPLYCSGQSHLPNGDIFLAGGNFVWPDAEGDYEGFSGAAFSFTFDPFRERWVRQPDMAAGRWYPSQVLLPDGDTLIMGGYTEKHPGNDLNKTLEVFDGSDRNGGVGTIEPFPHDRGSGLYPHLFVLPGGDVALAGPNQTDLARLDLDSGWEQGDSGSNGEFPTRTGGTAILLPQGPGGSSEIVQIGGFDRRPEFGDSDPATGQTPARRDAVLSDFGGAAFGYEGFPSLRRSRSYHNTVLLPDRSLVTVGGAQGFNHAEGNYWTDSRRAERRRRRVELLDLEGKRRWKLGPSQREDRTYHSTALLLPDGRVWSAGDDGHPYNNRKAGGFSTKDTAEIYKPPYLYLKGKRPQLKRLPKQVGYGDDFGVRVKKSRATEAVLVAPSAVTHAADMSQRLVPLEIQRRRGRKGLDLVSPPGADIAPPGYYMLFVLNRRGEPSKAKFFKLDPSAPDAPTLAAPAS